MTEKELRRLSRMDLLEMLLEQSKEVEQLRAELETVKKQLEDRRIMEQEAGSIAEAALRLNKVFEAAQQAADQYLENIRTQAEISQNGETENEAE
ncbi:DNA repair protein [Blautia sp. MSJ-9]|uniref:DNA repair protein n=1 Tax=Blautia sp. MSJ-9 TaxID=2841511 RepID=UPI001C1208FC|nr:DNA repair protein [Blautia sp. MSJ-9]MBU5679022.1 DNA repair protein [Blautia sp. MSJ-9]